MIFESIEHARHYASGLNMDVVFYENKVIDVTEFKEKHPGGLDSIIKHIDKDITKEYKAIESHQTKTADKDMDEFCIGTIKTDAKTHKPIATESDYKYDMDLKKGVLWQVFTKLNKTEYLHFIHDPKHMINPPEAILFESPYLEFFTKTPWYIIPMLWLPIIYYFINLSLNTLDIPTNLTICLYLVGLFLWTLVEYVLHRFVFHLDEKVPDHPIALMAHFLFHGIHHAFPMDRNRLVFPPVAAFPIFQLLKYTEYLFFGQFHYIILAGTLTGYIMYDLTHYFIHHNKPVVSYFKNLKSYHILHHYKNPKLGFGVSNKLWDYICGTVLPEN